MALKKKDITINKVKYTITELTARPLLPIMKSDKADDMAIEMAKISISVKGKPIGEDLLDLGFSVFNKLLTTVNEVNGMGEEGND